MRLHDVELQAGDVIGFAGRDAGSAFIALGTWGVPGVSITHVGILAESPQARELLLWEATAELEMDCVLAGQRVAGIQAHRLADRIAGYRGVVWHYPLAALLTEEQSFRLTGFLSGNLGRSYDFRGAWRARQFGFGWLLRKLYGRENLSSLFCSEAVAAALRACDAWDPNNASAWSPRYLCRQLVADGVMMEPERIQ